MRYIIRLLFLTMLAFPSVALSADYEVRKFEETQWFVFDGTLDHGLFVNSADTPQCHEIGEIFLFLENKDQALDNDLLQTASREALGHYKETCQSLGQRASDARKVIAFLPSETEPDNRGRVPLSVIALEALITPIGSTDGQPRLEIRRNNVAQGIALEKRDEDLAAQRKERERKAAEDRAQWEAESPDKQAKKDAEIAEARAKYQPRLAASLQSAQSAGWLDWLTSGDKANLTGAWSGSQAQCSQEVVIFIDRDGKGVVEWWRTQGAYGMLPWRSGTWELRDGTLIMALDHKVEKSFINSSLEDKDINETTQLNLMKVTKDELRLSVPGTISDGLSVLGAGEKLFVLCSR